MIYQYRYIQMMNMQKSKCLNRLAELSRYCGLADASVSDGDACGKLLEAIGELIDLCGFESKKEFIPKEDYKPLARAIAWDSINYTPPIVMSDKQIYAVLDEINRK